MYVGSVSSNLVSFHTTNGSPCRLPGIVGISFHRRFVKRDMATHRRDSLLHRTQPPLPVDRPADEMPIIPAKNGVIDSASDDVDCITRSRGFGRREWFTPVTRLGRILHRPGVPVAFSAKANLIRTSQGTGIGGVLHLAFLDTSAPPQLPGRRRAEAPSYLSQPTRVSAQTVCERMIVSSSPPISAEAYSKEPKHIRHTPTDQSHK